MLHILFLVFKIIGMILLAVLGILILLLGIVFFIPANYLIQAKTEEGIKALSFEVKAHWFLHLFTAYYIYKDKESDWQVRIGWKTFNHKDHENSVPNFDNVIEEDIQSIERADGTIEGESESDTKSTDAESHDKKDKCKDKEQKQSWFQKIKCTILKIYDKIKSFWETKEKVTSFFTDDVHIEAFKIVKTELAILARHLRPRRIRGFVRFGFEDPYRTGQVLAGLSVLYPFYGDNIDIDPNFEQKILVGNLYIKGHIRTVHLVALLWRLFFNRYVRRTYRDYKKLNAN